jgi:hypothetical protein
MLLGDTVQMSTQTGAPYLLSRVAARAGVGLWRNRGGVLVVALAAVALGGYVSFTSITGSSGPLASAGLSNTDCADTAMAAIADKSPAATQRAYQCMDTSFRQRVSEADFVRQMQSQTMPNVEKLSRVGDYRTLAGGTMVYYALDGGGQSVGYIVYLGQDGKVLRIE